MLYTNNTDYGWKEASAHSHQLLVLPVILEALKQRGSSLDLLDLGCGSGWLSEQYRLAGHNVVASDRAEDGLRLARTAYPLVKFVDAEVDSDLSAICPNGLDAIVCSEVIEHLYDPAAMIARAFEALKPDGLFVLTTPYHGYAKNLAIALLNRWDRHHGVDDRGGHIKFFSYASLTKMLSAAGFTSITFKGVGRLPLLWKSMIITCRKPTNRK